MRGALERGQVGRSGKRVLTREPSPCSARAQGPQARLVRGGRNRGPRPLLVPLPPARLDARPGAPKARVVRTLLVLVLATACSGNAGVREHSEALAVATHCHHHDCPTTAEALNLGEGCYLVDDRLYQCSTDGPGEASCFEISPCREVCDNTVTDSRGFEISTERCESLRWAYRRAHPPPPTCAPVELRSMGSVAAHSPLQLALPDAQVLEVVRAGKNRVVYEAEACATGDGVVVGEPVHATGFADLDEVLRGEAAKVALPPGECANVVLVLSRFECH